MMNTINNIILGLTAKSGYHFAPSARHYFAADVEEALRLLFYNFENALDLQKLTIEFFYTCCKI